MASIGAMCQHRIQDFYIQPAKAGLYKPGEADMLKVATLQFFNTLDDQHLKAQLTKRR